MPVDPRRVQVVIPAAGAGVRLGSEGPKALIPLAGVPMLVHALRPFAALQIKRPVIITAAAGMFEQFDAVLSRAPLGLSWRIIAGGVERQDSVRLALEALDADAEIVAIHDAARPFVAAGSISDAFSGADEFGAATVAIPSADTILQADADRFLDSTPDRRQLWACQTPQVFRIDVIRAAHAAAAAQEYTGTDDATLVRRNGGRVKLIMGTPLNFKVTTPSDLALARLVAEHGLA